MDANYISALAKAYPWATESTMQEMLRVVSVDAATKKKILDTVKNQPTDYSEIVDVLRNKKITIKKATDVSIKFIKSMDRDTGDIDKMFGMAEDIAWASVELADALEDASDWTKFMPPRFRRAGAIARFGRVAADAAEIGTVAIATGVSASAFFSKFAFEQDKIIRTMIDYGLVLGDRTQYTNIRDAVNLLGLTENEFIKNAQGFGPVFANLGTNTYDGVNSMLKMANEVYTNENNLGFSAEDTLNRLMNESSTLFKLGEIQSFNASDTKAIARGFTTSVGIASMLAELTGQDRTQYLQNRLELLEDIDFMTAFNKNREYLNETFGEGHSERVRENITLITELAGMLTPELRDATKESLTRHLYDIDMDSSVLNNITPAVYKQLALLGSDVQTAYLELMTMAINDPTADVGSITLKFQDFAKLIRSSEPVQFIDSDAERDQARSIQDNSLMISQSFINASQDQFYVASYLDKLIDIDDPIRAVDQFRQDLTIIRNKLVPGYDTTGIAIDKFSGGMKFIADTILGSLPEIPNDGPGSLYTDSYLAQKAEKEALLEKALGMDTSTQAGMEAYVDAIKGAIVGGNRTYPGQYFQAITGVDFSSIDRLFGQGTDGSFTPENIPPSVAAKRIADALNEFGITDQRAVANILGMIAGESNFKLIREQSYSGTTVARIKRVLASRALFYTDAELERLKMDDRAFYDAMYGEPQGERRRLAQQAGKRRPDTGGAITDAFVRNGDMGGYDYRGKGYVQITGEDTYRRIGEFLGIDLLGNPDLTLDPIQGPRIAAAYYATMSDARKANFTDIRKVYTYTWGADPSNGRMEDFAARTKSANTWYAMMNDARWNEIDTSITSVTGDGGTSTDSESRTRSTGITPSGDTGQNLIDSARQFSGAHERTDRQELNAYFRTAGYNIDPVDTPWCGYFVSSLLTNMGIKPAEQPGWSRSYLDWGQGVSLSEAKAGDIVVFQRGNDPTKGHVGIFMGFDANGNIRVLGGNQSDQVKESIYSRHKLLGVRRATPDMIPQSETPPVTDRMPTVQDRTDEGIIAPRPTSGPSADEWDSRYSQTHNANGTPINPVVNNEINIDVKPKIDTGNETDNEITTTLEDVTSSIQKSNTERESVQ